MPSFVLKLDREHDAYVLFSTVVDGVVSKVLTRDEMVKQLKREAPGIADYAVKMRLARADRHGDSSLDGFYSWDCGTVLFLDGGDCNESVPREKLYEYVMGKEG